MTGRTLTQSNLKGPRRARASDPRNRRGSRRAVFDLVEIDGEKKTRRRARALKRAAYRVNTPKLLRRANEEQAVEDYLEAKSKNNTWLDQSFGGFSITSMMKNSR